MDNLIAELQELSNQLRDQGWNTDQISWLENKNDVFVLLQPLLMKW